MKAADPFRFLYFDPAATRRIAASPWAILVGALLVVTAGIARNYDHLDLFRNAEWIAGPFVVSLISCTWIFFFVAIVLGLPSKRLPHQWLVFLSFFWMTAPCAWIYALPVEQWTDPVGAAKWNIGFLVTVSIWRVALISNALRVLTGNHWWRSLFAVLLPASIEMLVALQFKRLEIVGVMGGVRIAPDKLVVLHASQVIAGVCLTGIPFVLIMHLALRPWVPKARKELSAGFPERGFPTAAVLVALALIGIASAAALLTVQPRVRHTREMNHLANTGNWDAVLELAARTSPADYSPHHFFPPDPYRSDFDRIAEIAASHGDRAPKWLLDEWHGNALITLEIDGQRHSGRIGAKSLATWAKSENGKRFLTTHRDKVLAATHELESEKVRAVIDFRGDAIFGDAP